MPAVVRVKRRIDEEPLSAFLLNGKKRRLEDGGDGIAFNKIPIEHEYAGKEEISTVLKFAGTINKQNDTTQMIRLTKAAAKKIVQQKSNRRSLNNRERERIEQRHEQRFRVVNCMRTTLDAVGEDAEGEIAAASTLHNEITILDIETEKSPTKNEAIFLTDEATLDTMRPSDSDTGYVYDLYWPENEQIFEDVDMEGLLSVRAVNHLVFEDYYDNDESETDSEDSNVENYYTNDYPDEEDENFSSGREDNAEYPAANYSDLDEIVDTVEKFVLCKDEDEDSYAECSSEDESAEENSYLDLYDPEVDPDNSNESADDKDTKENQQGNDSDCNDNFHSASDNDDTS